jgi:hypothetical protein
VSVISLEIPSGPFNRFADDIELPDRLPVALEGRDEPVLAKVLAYDVRPRSLRVTLEIDDRMPSLECDCSRLSITGSRN